MVRLQQPSARLEDVPTTIELNNQSVIGLLRSGSVQNGTKIRGDLGRLRHEIATGFSPDVCPIHREAVTGLSPRVSTPVSTLGNDGIDNKLS